MTVDSPATAKLTQAERRERTRSALLRSGAQELSRHGYRNLTLDRVARNAGYTRGALYHLFDDKDDLVLAVIAWVSSTWLEEVGGAAEAEDDPVDALLAMARGHAVYCRQEVSRAPMAVRIEFGERDHPIPRALGAAVTEIIARLATLITAGRRSGGLPPGPPPKVLALALLGALEGVVIQMEGRAPYDVQMAERVGRGLLGLEVSTTDRPPSPAS